MLLILIKSLKLVSLRFGFVFCSFCMSCCNVMLRFFRKRSKFLFSFFHKEEFLFFFLPGKSMPRHDCYIYYF